MHEYTVLKPFERNATGDTVSLNARQAAHLLRGAFIKLKPTSKAKAKAGGAG